MKSKCKTLNLIKSYIFENYVEPTPEIKFSKIKRNDFNLKENNSISNVESNNDSSNESLMSLSKNDCKVCFKSVFPKIITSQGVNLIEVMDNTWSTTVFSIIDEKYYKDSEVYKRAGISKQTFSKIRKDPDYRPKRDTAIQMCIGLKLSLVETNELLLRAGFGLSNSNKRDLVVKFFIEKEIYNIRELNYVLYDLSLELFK